MPSVRATPDWSEPDERDEGALVEAMAERRHPGEVPSSSRP